MSSERANCLTMEGADRIAQKIEEYWVARGFEPRMIITTTSVREHSKEPTIYMVRSNMVNGYPPARPRA